MKQITVSSPGKLILFGEHAVVYGYPSLVTAVDQRLFVTVEKIKAFELQIDAQEMHVKVYKKSLPQLGKGAIPKEVQFIEIACRDIFRKYKINTGIKISTKSEFSSQFGFGSSSAVTVATIKAVAKLFDKTLSNKELFMLAYKTVLDIQKKGSGIDVAAAVYGGTIYFKTGGKVIKPCKIDSLPLIVGYSGIKADTVDILTSVQKKAEKYPSIIKSIYKNIALLMPQAKGAIEKKDWKAVGELMDVNQGYLESLGVSSQKLSAMIYAARSVGAYGAKLSGAGGGDCMLALSDTMHKKNVMQAIEKTGGEILAVKTHAEGVRVEL